MLLTPNNLLKSFSGPNNGKLVILVSGQIIHTSLKQREERGVGGIGGVSTT